MDKVWATVMMVSGGLFAGGVMSIAAERIPAWRMTQLPEFRIGFAQTLRRVDRLQPALLSACLLSTIGFAAVTAAGAARTLALVAAAGFLLVLVGSVAWLVPIQRTLKAGMELSPAVVERLRARWLRGHLVRTVLGVALFILTVVATTL